MAQNLVTEGETAYWYNKSGADVKSGQPVVFGDRMAVALKDIPNESAGTVSLVHVFSLTKVPGEEFGQGVRCYLTTEGKITTNPGDANIPFAGFAYSYSAAGEPDVEVKIG